MFCSCSRLCHSNVVGLGRVVAPEPAVGAAVGCSKQNDIVASHSFSILAMVRKASSTSAWSTHRPSSLMTRPAADLAVAAATVLLVATDRIASIDLTRVSGGKLASFRLSICGFNTSLDWFKATDRASINGASWLRSSKLLCRSRSNPNAARLNCMMGECAELPFRSIAVVRIAMESPLLATSVATSHVQFAWAPKGSLEVDTEKTKFGLTDSHGPRLIDAS